MPSLWRVTTKDDIEARSEYFDRRITIEKPVDVPDTQGGFTRTWQTVRTTWAHFETWKGKEYWEGDQGYGHSFERVLLRYTKNINVDDTMRIRYKSRIILIRWVGVPAESRKVIEIQGDEIQAKGSVA